MKKLVVVLSIAYVGSYLSTAFAGPGVGQGSWLGESGSSSSKTKTGSSSNS